MSRPKVRLTSRAESDVAEIGAYIARDNPDAADRWLTSILETLYGLGAFALRGRACPFFGKDCRRWVHGSYIVYYLARSAEPVLILRVVHGARRLGPEEVLGAQRES